MTTPIKRRFRRATAGASLSLLVTACAQFPTTPAVLKEPSVQLDPVRLAAIDHAVAELIGERKMPGAVIHVERAGEAYQKAYGLMSYEPGAGAVGADTVFDAASLSKVISTAPAVMLLVEEGKIALDAPLTSYFPECSGGGKEAITVRHLLTHASGLPAGLPAKPAWKGADAAHALACAQTVTHEPGTMFRYSDVNYILLGRLVQRISGQPLDVFAQQRLFTPLRMHATGYRPLDRMAAARIAPTQKSAPGDGQTALHPDLGGGEILQGVVHDPTVRRMDGVAGSAGVFSTVSDLARFARMMLGDGVLDGVRVLSKESVRLMTTVQSPAAVAQRRALGMDIDSPFARPRGRLFPLGSYGHTGFTGCILWVDPYSKTFYVFLSNRVYPDDKSNILPLYSRLGTLAAEAVRGFDFSQVKGIPAPSASP